MGMELFGHDHHSVRRGAVSILSELARSHPREFYLDVLSVFAAFLAYPPKYAKGHARAGEIDLSSDDTVEIVKFINNRTAEQKLLEREGAYDLKQRLADTPFRLRDDRVEVR